MTEEQGKETTPAVALTREAICVEKCDGPVTLRLLDAALWQAFRQEGTEMIITKAGRRMFPFVMVTLEGLSPTLLYSVHLSLVPCDNRQYKFCQRRWVSVSDTAPGPTPVPGQSYVHPASPNRGSFWCQEMISFAKLKITNNKHSQGDIVLQSMRKYMAQITVREDLGNVEYVFTFPETTFVAVTQYQNEAVTRMKIAHNPFANGFKYAHVTGSDDVKKIFPRADSNMPRSQDSKQKYPLTGSGKSAPRTARVKATVTPQALAPGPLGPLDPSGDDRDVQPASHAHAHVHANANANANALAATHLPDPSAQRPQHLSPLLLPPLKTEAGEPGACLHQQQQQYQDNGALPGGFPVGSSAVAISPYVFEPVESETEPDVSKDVDVDVDVDVRSPGADTSSSPQGGGGGGGAYSFGAEREDPAASDEEDRDDSAAGASSSTMTPIPTCAIPTTVTDADEDLLPESGTASFENSICLSDQHVTSLAYPTTRVPPVVQNLPQPSRADKTDTFKQPLPRKGSVCSKKNMKKTSSSSSSIAGHSARSDVDIHWYRNALRQARQRQPEPVVKSDRGVQLKLHDSHIWHSFAACGSKMVISAEGRHMFPVISFSLRGLDPGRLYSVWLHVTATDDVTFSHFRDQGVWGPVFPAQRLAPSVRPYMHPCSPMRGLAWMKVKVTFNDVRLTSDVTVEDASCLSLLSGRRYLTQVVLREEEEVTPGGTGSAGDLLFFPLPEVTFLTNLDGDEIKLPLPASLGTTRPNDTRKRTGFSANHILEDDTEESEDSSHPPTKLTRSDSTSSPWMKSSPSLPRPSDFSAIMPRPADLSAIMPRPADLSAIMPRPADLSAIMPRPADLSAIMPRPVDLSAMLPRHPADISSILPRHADLPSRLNPVFCFPPVSTLPPAHVGLLANRMPLQSPLQQSIASFPFQPQLFPQLRTPMHSAFGMGLPPFNPLPYFYYPYSAVPSMAPPVVPDSPNKGLDLSCKSSE